MAEAAIVHTALDHLEQLLPVKTKWMAGKGFADGQVLLKLNGKELCMEAEVKVEVKTSMLPRLLDQGGQLKHFMVIAETIQPKAKEVLRAKHIAYLEGNGNIYLNDDNTFFFIDTQKPAAIKEGNRPKAFTDAETRVLYQFLLDETFLNLTYREIAEKTATALGGITPLFKKLEKQGFLIRRHNVIELKNKRELLNNWVAAYEQKVHPKLYVGRFRFVEKEKFLEWKTIDINRNKTWWGAEPAADLITGSLRPGALTLYTREDRLTLIRKYRLAPDPNGQLVLLNPFWPEQMDSNAATVPPLLVYADLLLTGDHRCMETAQKIYDEILKPVME